MIAVEGQASFEDNLVGSVDMFEAVDVNGIWVADYNQFILVNGNSVMHAGSGIRDNFIQFHDPLPIVNIKDNDGTSATDEENLRMVVVSHYLQRSEIVDIQSLD